MSHICVSCKSLNSPPAIDFCHTAPSIKLARVTSLNSEKVKKNKIKSTLHNRDDKEEGERSRLWLKKKKKKNESKINRMTRPQTEKMA